MRARPALAPLLALLLAGCTATDLAAVGTVLSTAAEVGGGLPTGRPGSTTTGLPGGSPTGLPGGSPTHTTGGLPGDGGLDLADGNGDGMLSPDEIARPRGGIEAPADGTEAERALAVMNKARALAGLAPVPLDPVRSQGCQAHAEYLRTNMGHPSTEGLGAHNEDPALPGYTKEGQAAGGNSVITFITGPEAIYSWLDTFYHRMPLIAPDLKAVGLGAVRAAPLGFAVMSPDHGAAVRPDQPPVAYPADGQRGVPTIFTGELPNPLPPGAPPFAGYPITLQFPAEVGTLARAQLFEEGGGEVACHVYGPGHLTPEVAPKGTVALIAKRPLRDETTYRVEVEATPGGRVTWKFTTGTDRLAGLVQSGGAGVASP